VRGAIYRALFVDSATPLRAAQNDGFFSPRLRVRPFPDCAASRLVQPTRLCRTYAFKGRVGWGWGWQGSEKHHLTRRREGTIPSPACGRGVGERARGAIYRALFVDSATPLRAAQNDGFFSPHSPRLRVRPFPDCAAARLVQATRWFLIPGWRFAYPGYALRGLSNLRACVEPMPSREGLGGDGVGRDHIISRGDAKERSPLPHAGEGWGRGQGARFIAPCLWILRRRFAPRRMTFFFSAPPREAIPGLRCCAACPGYVLILDSRMALRLSGLRADPWFPDGASLIRATCWSLIPGWRFAYPGYTLMSGRRTVNDSEPKGVADVFLQLDCNKNPFVMVFW